MTMKALAAEQFGTFKDVLSFQSIAKPEGNLAASELVIKVAYSDVNPVDLQKLSGGPRGGQSVGTAGAIFVPGYGGSGTIVQVGSGVPSDLAVGSRVCFLGDPSRVGQGSYSEFVTVDHQCVAPVPSTVSQQDASVIALAGCTAFEALVKLQLSNKDQRLLIVGGAGGVGSWATALARAWHQDLDIIATVSREELSSEWCLLQGATRTILHGDIESAFKALQVDAILCLTEPTSTLFKSLAEVIRPYGRICLVVGGSSIQSLDLGFCFFKSVTLMTETVFSSIRSNFQYIQPGQEMKSILELLDQKRVRVPLSPQLSGLQTDWKHACEDNGVLATIASGHTRGKLFLSIAPEL